MEHNLVTVEWWSELRQFFDRFSSTYVHCQHVWSFSWVHILIVLYERRSITHTHTHTGFPFLCSMIGPFEEQCLCVHKKKINKPMKQKKVKNMELLFHFWQTQCMVHNVAWMFLVAFALWEGSRSWPWRWNPLKSPQHHLNKEHPHKMSFWLPTPSLSL